MSGIDTFTLSIEDKTYTIIGHIEWSKWYDWSADAILRREPDGQLFYFHDAGCSCNYFADSASAADLKPVYSIAEAIREVSPLNRDKMQKSIDNHGAVETYE
jgi:hypothetical protein